MKLTISDIQDMTDPGSFQRGVDYFKRGRVQRIQHQTGSNTFTAQVAGSGRKIYTVSAFKDSDGLYGECSCPVMFDCKHCVAAALQWLSEYGNSQPATQRSSATPLEQWLAQIPRPRTHLRDDTLAYGQSYVLYQLQERFGRIIVTIHKGYLKKTENGANFALTRLTILGCATARPLTSGPRTSPYCKCCPAPEQWTGPI